VLEIAHQLGLEWMASDEGVLGRSIGCHFDRDATGRLMADGPDRLYRVYRYQKADTRIHLLFRDHALSDLIGFVYSGMPPKEAAENFIHKIKSSAQSVLQSGRDAVVPVILDGENAWEYYHQSGREFLRCLYDAIRNDPQIQAVTVSEAIHGETAADLSARASLTSVGASDRRQFARLDRLVPGSWIHANFNVWIGAPEDNRAWDYLSAARDFYANNGMLASPEQRAVAFDEILIAEGSDWNWWYGPEHHTANDRDFDELYRKHLSNVYHALGAAPPEYLAQPIAAPVARPTFVPQTAYIRPRIGADYERYFDWIGAAMYTADRRAGAMHGKQFLLDSVYAGIDGSYLYGRLDFAGEVPQETLQVSVTCETLILPAGATDGVPTELHPTFGARLEVMLDHGAVTGWTLREPDSSEVIADQNAQHDVELALRHSFVFKAPLTLLRAEVGSSLRLRFSVWRDQLPIDALPVEGWLELRVVAEEELEAGMYNYSASS
jgi:hypothetical protein